MIKEYIESGILETYLMGATSEQEERELLRMKAQYPEVNEALKQLELDMERIAGYMAITPPPSVWNKIEHEITDLIERPEPAAEKFTREFKFNKNKGDSYIEVESESNHMRIHKNWKWVFAAVFVLGKIFLGCAIYFYLENRQAQMQINDLKTEIRHYNK